MRGAESMAPLPVREGATDSAKRYERYSGDAAEDAGKKYVESKKRYRYTCAIYAALVR